MCKMELTRILLWNQDNSFLEQSLRFRLYARNIKEKYEDVDTIIKLAKSIDATMIAIKTDSQLVINQAKSIYNVKDPNMENY